MIDDDSDDPEQERRSPVEGVLERIEQAEQEAAGLHCNQNVIFAGVICPIVCEEEARIQIKHGNLLLWIDKSQAVHAKSAAEKKGATPKWDSMYKNPLLPPHRQ